MKIFRSEPIFRHHFHDFHIGFVDRLWMKGEQNRPDFNVRMFNEDFARLFRSANRRNGNLFEMSSNDEALMKRFIGGIKTRYAPHSLDETIRELVEEIAYSLILFGTAYYFIHGDIEHGNIHVASFSSVGVVRLFGTHIQWVPRRTERHWDRDEQEVPREIRILDAAKIMCFDVPQKIGRVLSSQKRTLAALDRHQFGATDFHPQATYEDPNPINYFDFRVWKDMQDDAFYRSTRDTGWNGRKYDSSKRSDFFDCHRLIRFRRNQLMLRDDILKQLSSELSRVGKSYNTEFNVKISGTDELPSVEQLNELEARLTREEVGFTEVIKYCYNS